MTDISSSVTAHRNGGSDSDTNNQHQHPSGTDANNNTQPPSACQTAKLPQTNIQTYNRRLLLINGANLNLLGKREPEIYGHTTLDDIENQLSKAAAQHHITMICLQSNHEGELIEAIQYHGLLVDKAQQVDAIIINPAAFTHSSVAIRDALLATQKPFIEVHLSNIHQREPFRHHSYFSDVATGVICGLGHHGYQMALDYWLHHLYAIKQH